MKAERGDENTLDGGLTEINGRQPQQLPAQTPLAARIAGLNELLRAYGLHRHILDKSASDEAFHRASRAVIQHEAELQATQEGFYRGHPGRDAAIRRISGGRVARSKGLPSRVLSLFGLAAEKRNAAEVAAAEAARAEAAAAETEGRLLALKADLESQKKLLSDVVSARVALKTEHEATFGDDEWVAGRCGNWVNVGEGLTANLIGAYKERVFVERALAEIPEIEEIFRSRIATIETQIAALERDQAA